MHPPLTLHKHPACAEVRSVTQLRFFLFLGVVARLDLLVVSSLDR
jgi:hypothetical protein